MEGPDMTQDINSFPWLTILTAVPLVGALAVLALGKNKTLVRYTALVFSAISLLSRWFSGTASIAPLMASSSRNCTPGSHPST